MLILTLLLFLYTISYHIPDIAAKESMENQATRCNINIISKNSINLLVAKVSSKNSNCRKVTAILHFISFLSKFLTVLSTLHT